MFTVKDMRLLGSLDEMRLLGSLDEGGLSAGRLVCRWRLGGYWYREIQMGSYIVDGVASLPLSPRPMHDVIPEKKSFDSKVPLVLLLGGARTHMYFYKNQQWLRSAFSLLIKG
jgi:hypothetical protein